MDSSDGIREILGMRRRGAWWVLAVFVAALWVTLGASASELTSLWAPVLGMTVLSVMAVAVIMVPGDPLPAVTTWLVVAAGPVASALVISAVPPEFTYTQLVIVSHSAVACIWTFVIMRGRRVLPWVGLAVMVGVYACWGVLTGQSPAATAALLSNEVAPLAMGLLLSFTLRATAYAVFALREQMTMRIAVQAAEQAAADEREQQVRYLDATARRLLERIALGAELSDTERMDCEVLEAHLRDRLRAPLLGELQLDEPAYRARKRGVDVVLIDDSGGGEAALHPQVAAQVTQTATAMLDAAESGEIFVRIPPAGREVAASILHREAEGAGTRVEVGADGVVRVAG